MATDGHLEVLGFDVGDSEDGAFWTGFLRSLKARGLGGGAAGHLRRPRRTQAVHHRGVHRSRVATLPVHFLRNVLAKVPKGNAEMVAAAIRTIFAQPDSQHVHEQLDVIAGMLGRQLPRVEAMLRRRDPGHPRVYHVPATALAQGLVDQPARSGQQGDRAPHRRRRRLAQPEALLRLAGSVLVETHDECAVTERRFLPEGSITALTTTAAVQKVATPEQLTAYSAPAKTSW